MIFLKNLKPLAVFVAGDGFFNLFTDLFDKKKRIGLDILDFMVK